MISSASIDGASGNYFSFGATIKVRRVGSSDVDLLGAALPGVSTINLLSRSFTSYDECISSCTQLMSDVVQKLNKKSSTYKLATEVNPIYSGQPTLSMDWEPGEVSRVWVYDRTMEKKGQISAIGQARVFGSISLALNQLN
jgi:hypothetical protein